MSPNIRIISCFKIYEKLEKLGKSKMTLSLFLSPVAFMSYLLILPSYAGGRNFEHKEIGIKNSDYRTQLLGFKNTIFSIPVGLKNTLFFE